MKRIAQAKWIGTSAETYDICPVFRKRFAGLENLTKAELEITAHGLYEAKINGKSVTDAVLTPGWTVYEKRLQVQTYDVTALLARENTIEVSVGRGWYSGRMGWAAVEKDRRKGRRLLCTLVMTDKDGKETRVDSDESWQWACGPVLMSEFYDGETYDARITPTDWKSVALFEEDYSVLLGQEGEFVRETQVVTAKELITTPLGEKVIDFGQNLTGYCCFKVCGQPGDKVVLSHAEILDVHGNFYTANMRAAKNLITYICAGGEEEYHPHFSFQGFRYIRVDEYPGEIKLENFKAIVIHSDMRRTGYFTCDDPLVNRLFENVVWGQRGNFVDVPTDCPQRDERLGWTGDAEVFCQAASYIYDTEKFYTKWLADVSADQYATGGIPHVIPNILGPGYSSAGWGDAAVIVPWVVYRTFGNKELLRRQYPSMCAWVEFIRAQGENPYLWASGEHYGDWLGLDSPEGSYKGATDEYYIATAYYAYSTSLLIKAGRVLGEDVSGYEELYGKIKETFAKTYLVDGLPADKSTAELLGSSDNPEGDPALGKNCTGTCLTQTGLCLGLYFDLVPDRKKAVDCLAGMIKENGTRLKTGFLGTPYLLHVLSDNGYHDLACQLLLQKEYPSWLYPVTKGATTMWEHWDGIKPDGSLWSADMNSFNHYAYGALADWMFDTLCGIKLMDEGEGFKHIVYDPAPGLPLGFANVKIDTRWGAVEACWKAEDGKKVYELSLPEEVTAEIRIKGYEGTVTGGKHRFVES